MHKQLTTVFPCARGSSGFSLPFQASAPSPCKALRALESGSEGAGARCLSPAPLASLPLTSGARTSEQIQGSQDHASNTQAEALRGHDA